MAAGTALRLANKQRTSKLRRALQPVFWPEPGKRHRTEKGGRPGESKESTGMEMSRRSLLLPRRTHLQTYFLGFYTFCGGALVACASRATRLHSARFQTLVGPFPFQFLLDVSAETALMAFFYVTHKRRGVYVSGKADVTRHPHHSHGLTGEIHKPVAENN